MERTTKSILKDVESTLYNAKLGLKMIKGNDPSLNIPGMRNLVVFGRSVTFALQKLKKMREKNSISGIRKK